MIEIPLRNDDLIQYTLKCKLNTPWVLGGHTVVLGGPNLGPPPSTTGPGPKKNYAPCPPLGNPPPGAFSRLEGLHPSWGAPSPLGVPPFLLGVTPFLLAGSSPLGASPAPPAPGCGWSRREKRPRSGKDEIVDEPAKKWNQQKNSRRTR